LRFVPSTPLRFPLELVGHESSPQNLRLTNMGKAPVSISSFAVTGPFRIVGHCPGVIPAGASCSFSVVFTPESKGFTNGVLTLKDSASSSLQTVMLHGAGTVVEVNPIQLAFPPTQVGQESDAESVMVRNLGTTKIKISSINISGDFSRTTTCGTELGPGATCSVSVTFKPTRTGRRIGTLYINDSGGGITQKVPLSGTGT